MEEAMDLENKKVKEVKDVKNAKKPEQTMEEKKKLFDSGDSDDEWA